MNDESKDIAPDTICYQNAGRPVRLFIGPWGGIYIEQIRLEDGTWSKLVDLVHLEFRRYSDGNILAKAPMLGQQAEGTNEAAAIDALVRKLEVNDLLKFESNS